MSKDWLDKWSDKLTPEKFMPEWAKPTKEQPKAKTPDLPTGTLDEDTAQRISKSQDFRKNILSSVHLLSPAAYAKGILGGSRQKTKLTA